MTHKHISWRLVAAFGLSIAVLGSVGWVGLHRMEQMYAELEDILLQRWGKTQLAREALRYSNLNNRITMQVFLMKDKPDIEMLLAQQSANSARITSLLTELEAKAESSQERDLLKAIGPVRAAYVGSYKKALLKLLDEHREDEARGLLVRETIPNLLVYHEAWESFLRFQATRTEAAAEEAKLNMLVGKEQVGWLLVLGVVLVGMIGLSVTLGLARKTKTIEGYSQDLRQAHDHLEKTVIERTLELAKANSDLKESTTKLASALDEVRQTERRFRTLITNTPVGLYRGDFATEGRFLMVNPAMARIFGFETEDELLAKRMQDLYVDPGERALFCQEFIARGEIKERLLRLKRCDGTEIWCKVSAHATRDESNSFAYYDAWLEDITQAKRAEAELAETQKQLIATSREAGMAEVATGVLHNVGNVLTSVNVTSTCIVSDLRKSKVGTLTKIAALLQEHESDLGAFITQDPRGKRLPRFLGQLAEQLTAEQSAAIKALGQLQKNIDHIKDIVSMQQDYAKRCGVTERIDASELIEDALRLNASALVRHDVHLVRDFHGSLSVTVEKHKVLQILVNLIRNAKYACDESGQADKRLTLRTAIAGRFAKIEVTDNGIGIASENISRIFQHGFTTRKGGHGFGLHSSALAALELGGSLRAHSDGAGRGATFTLELPLTDSKA